MSIEGRLTHPLTRQLLIPSSIQTVPSRQLSSDSLSKRPSPLGVLRRLFPDAEVIQDPTPEGALYGGAYSEPPRLRSATIVEGLKMRAIAVERPPRVTFSAFLDGAQQVSILSHRHGVPLLFGTVAAAIRVRIERRLVTWGEHGPTVQQRFYMPLKYLPDSDGLYDGASFDGYGVVDTSAADSRGKSAESQHPGVLRARALDCIRTDREQIEVGLAEAWCASGQGPICIDGPIRGSRRVASSATVVGLVKSHQTLHADGKALDTVMRLQRGERSPVFRVEGDGLPTVVSWYLRLRDPRGRDAMFGLVRVEVADRGEYTSRADDVSSWILAEAAPLSLPDPRWDTMMYGVRNCEEFLRAISS